MSPEQLDGTEADARSDIFAFGALVYEMVTGRKAFEGKSQASLIASIMSADPPPMAALQPVAPAALDRVVRKCLEKDPDDRWHSAKDLADELSWIDRAELASSSPRPLAVEPALQPARSGRGRERLPWIVAGVLGAALIATLVIGRLGYLTPQDETIPPFLASLNLPLGTTMEGVAPGRRVAISPDGRFVVFTAMGADRQRLLWLRSTNSMSARVLTGTEGANNPFWSPDSKFIGFTAQGRLKKIEASGGPPGHPGSRRSAVGGTWSRDDVILFAAPSGGLSRVNGSGGPPVGVTPCREVDRPVRPRLSHQRPSLPAIR